MTPSSRRRVSPCPSSLMPSTMTPGSSKAISTPPASKSRRSTERKAANGRPSCSAAGTSTSSHTPARSRPRRTTRHEKPFEGERRLAYVAITRPKTKLILLHTQATPSPFLLEMLEMPATNTPPHQRAGPPSEAGGSGPFDSPEGPIGPRRPPSTSGSLADSAFTRIVENKSDRQGYLLDVPHLQVVHCLENHHAEFVEVIQTYDGYLDGYLEFRLRRQGCRVLRGGPRQ